MTKNKGRWEFDKFFRHRDVLKNVDFRQEFFNEMHFMNLGRLRVFGYFMVPFVLFNLYSDISLGKFWESNQVDSFFILDVILGIITISLLLVTHLNPPREKASVKKWHAAYIHVYVQLHLLWAAAIAIVESSTSDVLPTFLLGVYSAVTIFILRSIPFLLLLVSSLIVLLIGLLNQGMTIQSFITQHFPLIVLVCIAWIVSRILYNTRLRSFAVTKDLEIARNHSDAVVKERTSELQETNVKLLEEIKERKHYEESLKHEKRKAEEADRLKSVFLANMSHEIRTPLNGILGFSELLYNPSINDEKKMRYLEIIHSNGQQLIKIIDDIMDISMIESNQLAINRVNFRIGKLLPDTSEYHKNHLVHINEHNIKITNKGFFPEENDLVRSDPTRIQQVLNNLMNNAIKFTNEGEIVLGGKYEEGYVMVYVEDNGIGIQEDKCETIFERFRQGEESITRSYGGTGLGLSISKGIINLLGGMIWVDFSYEKGSRFCFSLPSAKLQNSYITNDKSLMLKLFTREDLIISSGNEKGNSALTYLLKCNNSKTPIISSVDFSIDLIENEPSLIILDTPSELSKSLEICHAIYKKFSRSRIIAIIHPEDNTNEKLLKAGCAAVLQTPINIQLLLYHMNRITSNTISLAKI